MELSKLRTLYAERIIPTLEKIPGCRYAGLMQSAHHPEDCISLTLWDTQGDAGAYEQSGVFARLLEETRPYLSESSESRIQISHDLTLEYVPIPDEPVVNSFPIAVQSDSMGANRKKNDGIWLRIVSLRVRPGKMEEFKRSYLEQVIPALRSVKGCRYIYLTENAQKPNEVISVTSWDSREDADEYQKSGLFDRLLQSEKDLLSELYQWKRDRDQEHAGVVSTSEDLSMENYGVLIGKDFK
jgi:heme-degrading monooxygenase HmoA